MVFKTLKPCKDGEKREIHTPKKKGSNDKKPQSRQKMGSEPHSPPMGYSYFGKDGDDPAVRLKLLQLAPRNPGQEASKGLQEFIKQMTKIISEKKNSFRDGSAGSKRRGEDDEVKNFENLRDEILEKNTQEKAKILNKRVEYLSKTKRSRTESPEKKREKMEPKTPLRKKAIESPNDRSEKYNPFDDRWPKSPKTPKSQPLVEQVRKKRLKRSEIPLLKNRRNAEKRTEVSLLLKKSLLENDSSTSIDLYQKRSSPVTPSPELEIVLQANGSSTKLADTEEVNQLKDGEVQQLGTPETPEENHLDRCTKNPNIPEVTKVPQSAVDVRKTPRSSKRKTRDLERVKTSSFTVLRTEVDSLTRLESFHQQNVSAKENARAELALKVSKMKLISPRASLTSLNSIKHSRAESERGSQGSRRSKSTSKKPKKSKTDRQGTPKKSPKTLETPHLDICREIMATGKIGCLIPKRVEKDMKDLKLEGKSISLSPMESPKTPPGKTQEGTKLKGKENAKKEMSFKTDRKIFKRIKIKKIHRKEEEKHQVQQDTPTSQKSVESVTNKQEDESEQKLPSEESMDEIKLTAKELANLVLKGTGLHFEKPSFLDDANQAKQDTKIDMTSDEEITDLLECEPYNDISGTSFDWLIKSVNSEEKPKDIDQDTQEVATSCDIINEITTKCDWQVSDSALQGTHYSNLPTIKKPTSIKATANAMEKKTKSETGEWRSLSGGVFNCPMYIQNDSKVRSGLTRSSNRDEKIFEDPAGLKLRRRNSEPYSFRGFIWKRADMSFSKSLKASVSSVPSSLRHLNTDEMDDFIFWEAVPQKMTSCWEMSLYHFKRPWSVLSCSVFKDNRRANTPGVILDTLRSGGLTNLRAPFMHPPDRLNRRKGNIFDVEPSISQKNIDIRNWLAALNFTKCISDSNDVISEGTFSTPPMITPQKPQVSPKRRNVVPELRLVEKTPEKKICQKEKLQRLDKWNISDLDELKEIVRRESGSYVTKEQYISELSNPRQNVVAKPCTHTDSLEDKSKFGEDGDQNTNRESKKVTSVEISCQSEPPEPEMTIEKPTEEPDEGSESQRPPLRETDRRETPPLPPEVNIWKYLFLFTLLFIVFQYSLGSTFNRT